MKKYLQLVSSFLNDFQYLKIEHMTRNKNMEADALSKLHTRSDLDDTWIKLLTLKSDSSPI